MDILVEKREAFGDQRERAKLVLEMGTVQVE